MVAEQYGIREVLKALRLNEENHGVSLGTDWLGSDEMSSSYSPVDGQMIAKVGLANEAVYDKVIHQAQEAFKTWRLMPAPARGEIVRQIGEKLRQHKMSLGKLVSYQMGKSYQEGLGEVQEMIDICDFAVGLSRQLHGYTMHSERPLHRMYEQWHPLGIVGIITAFNFPVAVWAWNTALACQCGDVCVSKPSEKTLLCAIASQKIAQEVFQRNGVPEGVYSVVNGDYKIGQLLAADERIPLISATGSIRMGKAVARTVSERLGRSLL